MIRLDKNLRGFINKNVKNKKGKKEHDDTMKSGRMKELPLKDLNLMLDLNDKEYTQEVEGPVTVGNWARTRRQRILKALSFDSEPFDIFDPCYSSELSSKSSNWDLTNIALDDISGIQKQMLNFTSSPHHSVSFRSHG